eukprot:UN04935
MSLFSVLPWHILCIIGYLIVTPPISLPMQEILLDKSYCTSILLLVSSMIIQFV